MYGTSFFKALVCSLAVAALAGPIPGTACTDFILKAKDNTCVVGRSLEFGQILPTKVKIVPSMQTVQSMAPNNQKGMRWTSKYAYAALVVFDSELVMDGFNDKGLSLGILWFPDAKYPETPKGSPSTVLSLPDIGAWLLGSFATVEEAKVALSKVKLYAAAIPQLGGEITPGLHLALHDASGKSLVIEWLDGKINLFDNDIGVMTNAPEFPWHVTNLRNFVNLSAINAGQVSIDGSVLQPAGQGTGLLGIPGDWTPPSRFVRTAVFKQFIQTPKNATEAVNSALHMLNTVDIPYGAVRATKTTDFDFTQWIVVKDLTNKKLYVRTYGNQNIQVIDFGQDASTQGKEAKTITMNDVSPT